MNTAFTFPKQVYPRHIKRIPRKLKKRVKQHCGVLWQNLTNGQRLWYFLEASNPKYKSFLIKQICSVNQINYKPQKTQQ